jgi:hypothetical protein
MKKLIFSTLFLLGMLASSQAQSFQLDYHFENFNNTYNWTFTIVDGNGQTYTTTINGMGSDTGTLPLPAVFPIKWEVVNNIGCSEADINFTNVGDTPITAACPSLFPPSVSGVYKIEQLSSSPLVNIFKMGMN